jgi:23S rRNA (cytidine2498-2'-O)-methyltransferase
VDLIALAPRDFERPLQEELGPRVVEQRGRLFTVRGTERPVWAQNLWLEPHEYKFESISQAAAHLRSIQRNWVLHSIGHHRRAQLIQDKLPPLKSKLIKFTSELPTAPLGSWTLWDPGTILYSANCTSPYPDGEVAFVENKTEPPSRAYLKLWEFFQLERVWPKPGERVIDLGSSPGGWTWVLDQLGAKVLSVDKAPLAQTTRFSSRVTPVLESAFSLDPLASGGLDWLFSDVICYPERLLNLVRSWLEADTVRNMVCTVKLQGPTDFDAIKEFRAIPGSKLQHLCHNKHELTWSLIRH